MVVLLTLWLCWISLMAKYCSDRIVVRMTPQYHLLRTLQEGTKLSFRFTMSDRLTICCCHPLNPHIGLLQSPDTTKKLETEWWMWNWSHEHCEISAGGSEFPFAAICHELVSTLSSFREECSLVLKGRRRQALSRSTFTPCSGQPTGRELVD